MIPSTGVIVPSAGRGTRLKTGEVKQFRLINGLPVLEHTLRRLLILEGVRHIVIPTSPDLKARTLESANRSLEATGMADNVEISVINGGGERMDSVENGLKHLLESDVELVLVHDAVRPCFSADAVRRAMESAMSKGAAILAVPAKDTVKIVDTRQQITSTPDRSTIWLAQTPQVFRKELLVQAYEKAHRDGFRATDDASLVEFAGYPVYIIEGSWDNIKITYPADLFFAEKWLTSNKTT